MTNYPTTSRGKGARRGRQPFRFMLLAALVILMARAGAAQATAYYTLYSFKGDPDGAQPQGAVVIGKGGALYGTTCIGGTSRLGTVFELTPTKGVPWKETVLHNFSGPDGQYPESALVFGSTGALYGVTPGSDAMGGPVRSSNWHHPPLREAPGRRRFWVLSDRMQQSKRRNQTAGAYLARRDAIQH